MGRVMRDFLRVGNVQLDVASITSVKLTTTFFRIRDKATVRCAGQTFRFYDNEASSLWTIFTAKPAAQQTGEACN